MQPDHDALYREPRAAVGDFSFDQAVVDVFPDMLNRSIPGYRSIITQSGLLAARYAQPYTNLYDLGSSLGATSFAMQRALAPATQDNPAHTARNEPAAGCQIHAIDNSPAMIDRCRELLATEASGEPVPITLHCDDLFDFPLQNASVVAMNFTLQFIEPAVRAGLLERIHNALLPGGVLILSEKLAFANAQENQLHTEMYHAFKRANGYSDLEIAQKRSALEKVMIPDTLHTHQARLAVAGFERTSIWFQCFNFASLIALRA